MIGYFVWALCWIAAALVVRVVWLRCDWLLHRPVIPWGQLAIFGGLLAVMVAGLVAVGVTRMDHWRDPKPYKYQCTATDRRPDGSSTIVCK